MSERRGYVSGTEINFKSKSGKWREYDMRCLSESSAVRFQRFLNSDVVEKRVEFDDNWLTTTVYFWYSPK